MNTAFILAVIAQLLRIISSSTADHAMVFPRENVNVNGLASDVQMVNKLIDNPVGDIYEIKPVDPRGVVIPTSTDVSAASGIDVAHLGYGPSHPVYLIK